MMEYKGYLGTVEYDAQAKIFHGDIVNTRDVITFQRTTVKEIEKLLKILSTIIFLGVKKKESNHKLKYQNIVCAYRAVRGKNLYVLSDLITKNYFNPGRKNAFS